jgi:hypothetical protein
LAANCSFAAIASLSLLFVVVIIFTDDFDDTPLLLDDADDKDWYGRFLEEVEMLISFVGFSPVVLLFLVLPPMPYSGR